MYRPNWKFRQPPENTEIFQMCRNPKICLLGNACTSAHSEEELKEWQIRRVCQIEQQHKVSMERKQSTTSYIQCIRYTINESRRLGRPQNAMIAEVSGKQSILCKQNLFVTHLDKNKEIIWEFEVTAKFSNGYIHGLQSIFFLESNPPEFSLAGLSFGALGQARSLTSDVKELYLQNFSQIPPQFAKVLVKFSSASYGNFNATVIFDFGFSPRIVRYLGVVVAPEKHLFETLALRPTTESVLHSELTWLEKHKLVPFDETSDEEEYCNGSNYQLPSNLHYGVQYGAFEHMDVELTRDNYRDRLHTLLYVEEYERRKRMSRLNVHCPDVFTLFRKGLPFRSLRVFDSKKTLFIPVNEETLEEVGVLVSRGSKALVRLRQFVYGAPDSQDFVVHEALVINILSAEIVLEISSKMLTLLNTLTAPVPVDICFRFVNTFLCMHSAIDRVNLDLLFYKPDKSQSVRTTPSLPHSVLSPAQTAALSRIINTRSGAPNLLLGPFGTGKTQTLAEAVKILIARRNGNPSVKCRILICTHSNSAADHYIENYLHPIYKELEEKDPSIPKPLRVYWEHRLAMTISNTMMPYCIMDLNTGTFRNPTLKELKSKMIIVTTLVTADILVKCGVKPGFFTHIFIDEAAQAMEVETLIPISLATKETKVVLAGDHLQLSPPVFSAIGRKLSLDKSLLVRLYESCAVYSPRKLLLLENFRSYGEIVSIPSKLFYEGSLVSKRKTPSDISYPIKFYGVQGLEEKAKDSPSYTNMAEVAEVSERVDEMVKTWPKEHWGELNLQKTCVLCAHYAQVRQIRRELRVNGFADVHVENVHNVQGLEFDVLFLSTVRTSRMLGPGQHEGKDLGFLSNPKLLNTAITRAKFSLIIIGDPKALCSVGDCRVCWKTILSLCSENGSFYYRMPLRAVLASIREQHTPTGSPNMSNNPQSMRVRATPPVRPNFGFPLPNQYPVPPVERWTTHPPGIIPPTAHGRNINLLPTMYPPPATPYIGSYPAQFCNTPALAQNSKLLPNQFSQIQMVDLRKPTTGNTTPGSMTPGSMIPGSTTPGSTTPGSTTPGSTSSESTSTSNGSDLRPATLYPPKEERVALNQDSDQMSVPEEALDRLSGGGDLIQTLHQNIATALRIVLENEEAVEICIEQPLEDTSVKVRENLKRQLVSIQRQKSQLEQQQQLNTNLGKTVREWQETWENGGVIKNRDHVEIIDYSQSSTPFRVSHVQKIDLSDDVEIREWYKLRRQDPIVQDYIKSFEVLSERARTDELSDKPMIITQCYQVPGISHSSLGDTLRGWVLQPDSVMYTSATCLNEEHLSKEEARKKIEDGELVSCRLLVDRSSGGNSAIAELDDPLEKNIYIPDRRSMNRAFNMDRVAVMITADNVEGKQLRLGKVVAILEERHRREAVCRLSSLESNSMIPLNNTNPKFAILQSQNHVGKTGVAVFGVDGSSIQFQHFVSDVKDKLFLVQFLKWDVNYQCPLGFAVKCFNECSNPIDSLPILFADYGIQSEFPAVVTEEVDFLFPDTWKIPDEEQESRRRYNDVFTVDVEGAEELDDAISVRPTSYGIYCVTVHVADVSYFVSKDSSLDMIAQRRGTSIYLPQAFNNTVPLLPRRLSHNLCSLVAGEERLAVSVEFIINSSGKVLETPVVHRSIVMSQRQFSYDEVDDILAGERKMTTDLRTAEPLLKSLQILHCLSRELWSRRVRKGSFQASTEESVKSASCTIIEEFMILTNLAVAEKLSQCLEPRIVPLRLHSSPKYHALQTLAMWVLEKGLNVNETYATKWLSGFQEEQLEMSNFAPVRVTLSTWKNMCQAIKSNNLVDLTQEILTVHKDSSLLPVIAGVQRLLPKGKYISSTQSSSTEHRHFALNADSYTHFTSPIRRYFDIVVHRVLLSDENSSLLYEDNEMEVLCSKLNLTCERVNMFSKHCTTVYKAGLLHETSGWKSMEVESLGGNHLTFRNSDSDFLSSSLKLRPLDMGVSMKEWNDDVEELLTCWTFQDVDVQCGEDLASEERNNLLDTSPPNSKTPSSSVTKTVIEVPAEMWCQLVDLSTAENIEALIKCQQRINECVVISLNSDSSCDEDDGVSVVVDNFGSHSVTRFFRRGDKVETLFGSSSFGGFHQPFLQAIQVAPGKVCCVQHHRRPVECFAQKAKLRARENYSSIAEYQLIHIPLLMMESAERSVRMRGSTIQLRNVAVNWTKDPLNVIRGVFHMPLDFLLPSMKIHRDDYVCIRSTSSTTRTVVCHGQVHSVDSQNNEKKELLVQLVLMSCSDPPDEGLFTLEIIPQCLEYRRMIYCVRNVTNATQDIRSLLLRRDLYTTIQSDQRTPSLVSSFVLGSSQKKSVHKAINSRLTLIEGSPGTGKTYTAAAIAEHFFFKNTLSQNVLFCCPTDQAVDIAADMLSRFSTVRICRVYGREIELKSFPDIAAMYAVSSNTTSDHCVQMDSSFQKTALHFRIRSHSNPFHEKIQKYTQQIKMLKENRKNRQQLSRVLEECRQAIKMAEQYELSENGVNVIMCTCIEAGSSRIREYGNIKQCIIDDSNMCSEAESLVVFQATAESSDRIILVGDRKQLAPVVQNKIARKFGLGRSLFQSLLYEREKKKFSSHVLNTQYRMHSSIRKFSHALYDDQSKDSEMLASPSDIGQLSSFWPADACRVMLCHVCGKEERCEELSEGLSKEESVCNKEEMKKTIEVLKVLNDKGVSSVQIVVLTPFGGQEALFKIEINKRGMKDVEIRSFLGIQGSERDIVIISTVRSLTHNEIFPNPPPDWLEVHLGVLADQRQTNVALTRARHGLIVIGNQDLLRVCPGWSDFVALCESSHCVL